MGCGRSERTASGVSSPSEKRALPENTWVEVAHRARTNSSGFERRGMWFWTLYGTGMWFNTGRTRVFRLHQEAFEHFHVAGELEYIPACTHVPHQLTRARAAPQPMPPLVLRVAIFSNGLVLSVGTGWPTRLERRGTIRSNFWIVMEYAIIAATRLAWARPGHQKCKRGSTLC